VSNAQNSIDDETETCNEGRAGDKDTHDEEATKSNTVLSGISPDNMTDIFSSGYGPVEVAFSLAHLAKERVRESCATTIAVRRPVLQRGQQG
jgi:hypothetical protein